MKGRSTRMGFIVATGIFTFLVTASPARSAVVAQDPAAFRVKGFHHYSLQDSPFSGPVEVIANTNHPEANRGDLVDVFLAVQNHSNTATASVVIEISLTYAGGEMVIPFNLGTMRTQTLGPDEGVGFFLFWVVPDDAPLGTATFAVSARVAQLTGGDGHFNYDNPMVATDSVTFEVIP